MKVKKTISCQFLWIEFQMETYHLEVKNNIYLWFDFNEKIIIFLKEHFDILKAINKVEFKIDGSVNLIGSKYSFTIHKNITTDL